jgi:hypothetical protein
MASGSDPEDVAVFSKAARGQGIVAGVISGIISSLSS